MEGVKGVFQFVFLQILEYHIKYSTRQYLSTKEKIIGFPSTLKKLCLLKKKQPKLLKNRLKIDIKNGIFW